jgi:hypothetical protein
MRFRLGCLLGFASGYYLGTRAGRARYDQLNRLLAKLRRTDAYESATGKAKDLVDDGVERAKDLVDDGVERAKDLVEDGVERASDFVEEHRSTGDVEGIPIGTVVGSDLDPTVSDLSPGPPPAGSLSKDPRR